MKITVVSDYVCPYCLVAEEALRIALERTGISAEITLLPYELTREGEEQVDTWSDPVRRSHYTVLNAPCEQMALPMHLPPHVVPRPYSTLAFEGWHFACEQGRGEAYTDAAFRAYFMDEQKIDELDVVCGIAEKAGLDVPSFREAMEKRLYREKQREAADYTRNVLKVHQVPTMYIDGEQVEINDYTPEEFVRLLTER